MAALLEYRSAAIQQSLAVAAILEYRSAAIQQSLAMAAILKYRSAAIQYCIARINYWMFLQDFVSFDQIIS